MAFVPPLFGKLGQAAKDLFSKKYDFKNQIGIKHNVQPDLSIESSANVCTCPKTEKQGEVFGHVKAKYKNRDFGEFEGEFGTGGVLTGEIKATKLADGLTVSVKGTEKPQARVGIEYRQEAVAASVSGTVESSTNKIEATLVTGFDNFSVGGQVEFDTAQSVNHHISDYNFGAEFTQPDYTLTLKTREQANVLVGSYFHTVRGSGKLRTQVGAELAWKLTEPKNDRTLAIGAEHDVDEFTTVKARVNTQYKFAGVLEHRLTNPLLKAALSAEWDGRRAGGACSRPERFGLALTFGDF